MADEEEIATIPYGPPVSELLTLGDVRGKSGWRDYLRKPGLTSEDIPELSRMVADDGLHKAQDDYSFWATIHAWRALAQLRAESAIVPLIGLLRRIDDDNNDWIGEELPTVFGMIGPAAIEPLAAYLADRGKNDFGRVAARGGLVKIAQKFPEQRDRVVAILSRQLSLYAHTDDINNAFCVSGLIDLRAIEQAPSIEEAYRRRCVDPQVCGSWEDVQLELGLKSSPKTLTPLQKNLLGRAISDALPKPGHRS